MLYCCAFWTIVFSGFNFLYENLMCEETCSESRGRRRIAIQPLKNDENSQAFIVKVHIAAVLDTLGSGVHRGLGVNFFRRIF